jgi:molybdenum cofactor cytidylyltransferase
VNPNFHGQGSRAAGLILAAGESRRMGSPKALLQYRGATFLDTLASLFAERCCPTIVVLGAHADSIRLSVRGNIPGVRLVHNENYLSGMTSSLQTGLRAVPADASGVLFTLVDHPAVSAETLDKLLAPPLPLLRIPRFAGERGHPVWFRRELIAEFLAVPSGGAANQVTRAHRAETEFLDVDDPGVVADIDDPAAYEALIAGPSAQRSPG